ncbi:acyl-CoA thioesterase [Candidatus Dependentiae bacterium]|nr:acyl-CoA thioesterase [Candidatus Dependentiae bacterium]
MFLKKSDEYKLITRHTVKQSDLNVHGNLFGGVMLGWIDEAGYVFSSEICKCANIVTVALKNVSFKSPAKLGDILEFYGKFIRIGKTSITVIVKANTYSVSNIKKNKPVIECEMVFVKLDKNNKPVPIKICR